MVHCRRSAILPGIESRRHSYDEYGLIVDLVNRGWAVWNIEYRRMGWRSRGGVEEGL